MYDQWYFIGELIYLLGLTLLKISVLIQYLRIFNIRLWVYILAAATTGYGASFIIAALASCKPFTYKFHRWQAEYSGKCANIDYEIYASNVINVILDGVITLLPTTQMQVISYPYGILDCADKSIQHEASNDSKEEASN